MALLILVLHGWNIQIPKALARNQCGQSSRFTISALGNSTTLVSGLLPMQLVIELFAKSLMFMKVCLVAQMAAIESNTLKLHQITRLRDSNH
jgi:hypothetical protein